ncbi:MAG: VanZ family protein [Planctomycetia bacterium]|nr:VanZ family protein [Planctomycetia bacterium]
MTHRHLQIGVAIGLLAAVAAAGLAIWLGYDPLAGRSMAAVSKSLWVLAAVAIVGQVLLRWIVGRESEPYPVEEAHPARSVFPTRWHYRAAFLFYLSFAIYGSLVPLKFQRMNLATAWEKFCHVPYLPLGLASRADWVANILLFIPLAYLAMAALTADVRGKSRYWMAVVLVIFCGASLSVTIELVQLWFPPRTVSVNDIVAETLGTLIGTAVWILLGDAVTQWLRSYSQSQRSEQIHRLLEFYLAGLVVYSLLPLDLTISPMELWHKYREGRLVLIPFSELRWSWAGPVQNFAPYLLLTDMATFVPVGMYLIDAWTKPRRLRSVLHATLLGAGFAAAIEVAQLAVFSRTTSTTQIISETLGACVGAALMRRWYLSWSTSAATVSLEAARRRAWFCFAAAGLYSLPLMVPIPNAFGSDSITFGRCRFPRCTGEANSTPPATCCGRCYSSCRLAPWRRPGSGV